MNGARDDGWTAVEAEFQGVLGDKVRPATSAYTFFQRDEAQVLKADGEQRSLADSARLVSERWKALSGEARAKYDALAREDRRRFEQETAARDAAAEEEQARRRAENNAVAVDGPRQRKQFVEFAKPKVERKKRELTEEQKAERTASREAREAREAEIARAQDENAEHLAQAAERRLDFLLKQSDIFQHFGAVSSGASKQKKRPTADVVASPSKRRMSDADADEDVTASGGDGSTGTFLLRQPSVLQGQLRPYQLEGLNWLIRLQENGVNGILADEMGLGKTLQSISILSYMLEFRNVRGPHLVLVPKSTLSNWMNEFRKFCPSLRPVRFHGSKEERKEMIETVLKPGAAASERDWDVLVTTYEVANIEKSAISKFAWNYLIIDEAHRLKNEASTFSRNVRALSTRYRLLITGTPLQNNLHELWALLNYLLPDVFASSEQFDEWFNLDIDDEEAKQRMIRQLHKLLRPFMLRRLKADVEKTLPPKTETILFTRLTPTQKDVYKNILRRDVASLVDGNKAGRTQLQNIVMQLRKVCNHPYLFPGVEDRSLDPLGEHVVQNCGKMVLLDKLLTKLYSRGNRVLVFCQMTRMLDILEDYCVMRGWHQKMCRIDGNTTYEDREDQIEEYNRPNSSKFLFLLSTRAGGLGINLQTADTCVLFDSDWNPQMDLQAQDRCHRIGQKKNVSVYRLVTEFTIEEKVVERAQQKLKLDAMVVQQGRLGERKDKISKDELLDAVRFGADKIFRNADEEITDEDIDVILEAGRKRTQALNDKLQEAEKGDLLDFKMDGGMKVQLFDGVDYSDKDARALQDEMVAAAYADVGKRERRQVIPASVMAEIGGSKRPRAQRVPKPLKLPKMHDWQFFERARIRELQRMAEARYEELKAAGELPESDDDLVLLPPELAAERARLLEHYFPWPRESYNAFLRACAQFGRNSHARIAEALQLSEDDVSAYANVFWTRGPSDFEPSEWERALKLIERGEKKLEAVRSLCTATEAFVDRHEDPWRAIEALKAQKAQRKETQFSAAEDALLLCLVRRHGYGSWDRIRTALKRMPASQARFAMDYHLQTLSADDVARRTEQLMRQCERDEVSAKARADQKTPQELRSELRRRAEELRADAARKAAKARERKADSERDLQQLVALREKLAAGDLSVVPRLRLIAAGKASVHDQAQKKAVSRGGAKAGKDGAAPRKARKAEGAPGPNPNQITPVPEEHLPLLARVIAEGGESGVQVLAAAFLRKGAGSARQVVRKVEQMGVKQKPEGGAPGKPAWSLRPEFQPLLEKTEAGEGAALVRAAKEAKAAAGRKAAAPADAKKSAKKARRAPEKAADKPRSPKKAADKAKSPKKAADKAKSLQKRARKGGDGPPRKPRSALALFAISMKRREEVKEMNLSGHQLVNYIEEEYTKLDEQAKGYWKEKEVEDHKRYEAAVAAYRAAGPGVPKKKRKIIEAAGGAAREQL